MQSQANIGGPASTNEAPLKQPIAKRIMPSLGRITISLALIIGAVFYAYYRAQSGGAEFAMWIAVAAGFGAYMALNIGANDVANNIGPTVGAGVLPLGIALILAAVFEFAGAIIAGGSVTGTVRGGIVAPESLADARVYVWVMMAALLAAALWLNLATMLAAPVSTTHSIVGGVMGGAIAAAGFSAVNWGVMANIAASWVISPLLGAGLAVFFLYLIKRTITYRNDILKASEQMIPVFVAAMGWSFATFLMLKGLRKIWNVGPVDAVLGGFVVAVIIWLITRVIIKNRIQNLDNGKDAVNQLLAVPLICAVALLSFAHGSNDVANAIAPLAGIFDTLAGGEVHDKASIPLWVMLLGALGLAVGLVLFGPKVIRTVGSELTGLDAMRAYCIAMAATVTVIIASQLGLPVSTTHVTVGAVLGVGFLREWIKTNQERLIQEIRDHHPDGDHEAAEAFIAKFYETPFPQRKAMLDDLKNRSRASGYKPLAKADRKTLKKAHKRAMVNRELMMKIFAAWIITVPATAFLAGILYFTLRGMMI